MIFESDATVRMIRDGVIRIYNPGEPIYANPDEAAAILLDTDLGRKVMRLRSRLPLAGMQATWKTQTGEKATGLIMYVCNYVSTREIMLLILHQGRAGFKALNEVEIDSAPLIQTIREAGKAFLSDNGPLMARNLLRTLFEDLEKNETSLGL